MVGRDDVTLFRRGCDKAASGQVVGSSTKTTRSLVDGGHRLFGEEVLFHSSDVKMMHKIDGHLLLRKRLQVSSSHHARSQGTRLAEQQVVDEVVLSGED